MATGLYPHFPHKNSGASYITNSMPGLSKNEWMNEVFVLEMTKEISGWSKHPSVDTILALKATKMLQ